VRYAKRDPSGFGDIHEELRHPRAVDQVTSYRASQELLLSSVFDKE